MAPHLYRPLTPPPSRSLKQQFDKLQLQYQATAAATANAGAAGAGREGREGREGRDSTGVGAAGAVGAGRAVVVKLAEAEAKVPTEVPERTSPLVYPSFSSHQLVTSSCTAVSSRPTENHPFRQIDQLQRALVKKGAYMDQRIKVTCCAPLEWIEPHPIPRR